MLASALGVGLLIGMLVMLPAVISRSWSLMHHKRKIQDLQDMHGGATRPSAAEQAEED